MVKVAAGFVIYRKSVSNVIEYLLLKASYPPYHWTPPKGHADKNETDLIKTALRETEEESGIKEAEITIDNLIVDIEYEVKGKPKKVTYYLGEVNSNTKITLSNEHTEFIWAELETAIQKIGFKTTGDVIRQCDNYVQKK